MAKATNHSRVALVALTAIVLSIAGLQSQFTEPRAPQVEETPQPLAQSGPSKAVPLSPKEGKKFVIIRRFTRTRKQIWGALKKRPDAYQMGPGVVKIHPRVTCYERSDGMWDCEVTGFR